MTEMSQNIARALEGLFHSKFLSVFFVSMFPVVEVRGGIPLGISMGMRDGLAWLAAVCAGFIIVPVILFLLKKVIDLMRRSRRMGRFGEALNRYFDARARKVEEGRIVRRRDRDLFKYLALFLFVAAPFPATGFWTGSAVAVFLGLGFWKSLATVTAGNLAAGGIVLLVSKVLGDNAIVVTIIFAVLLPVVVAAMILKMILDRKRKAEDVPLPDIETNNVPLCADTDNTGV